MFALLTLARVIEPTSKLEAIRVLTEVGTRWPNRLAALKNELVYRTVFPTIGKARRSVAEYIEVFDNRTRLHSGLGCKAPPRSLRSSTNTVFRNDYLHIAPPTFVAHQVLTIPPNCNYLGG